MLFDIYEGEPLLSHCVTEICSMLNDCSAEHEVAGMVARICITSAKWRTKSETLLSCIICSN